MIRCAVWLQIYSVAQVDGYRSGQRAAAAGGAMKKKIDPHVEDYDDDEGAFWSQELSERKGDKQDRRTTVLVTLLLTWPRCQHKLS